MNLSLSPRVAESMAHFPSKSAGLYELVQRVEAKRDPTLMKVIRNMSQWTYGLQVSPPTLRGERQGREVSRPSPPPPGGG